MKPIIMLLLAVIGVNYLKAQQSIGIGNSTPNASVQVIDCTCLLDEIPGY
ncbi:MAG: hypothetical protein ABIQ56_01540 [Chitinophagaceae bacterium]